MNRWYSKIGPFSWYKREWVRLYISIGRYLIIDATVRRRGFSVSLFGRVIRRSMFGSPSCVEPAFEYHYYP